MIKQFLTWLVILGTFVSPTMIWAQESGDNAAPLSGAVDDSVTEQFSIDELLKFRSYYQRQISELEHEKTVLRQEGIRDAEMFLERNPDSRVGDRVLIRLAELYIEEVDENFEEQMREYDRLISLYQQNEIDSLPSEPKKDYSGVVDLYNQLVNDYPHSDLVDDALFNIGLLYETSGHADSAFVYYNRVLELFPYSELEPDVLMRLGEYYFNPPINDIDTAISYFEKVLEFKTSPRYNEALYRLGWSYYRLNQYEKAISYFTLLADDVQYAKKYDPENRYSNPAVLDESIEYIGICFVEKGGPEAAASYLQKIGGRDYGVHILKRMGDAYMKEKEDYEKAIQSYEFLLNRYPAAPIAPRIQNNIVICYRRSDNETYAYVARDQLFDNYRPGTDWWQQNPDEALQEEALGYAETALRDNITFLYNTAQETERKDIYSKSVVESRRYLQAFPNDSSAQHIHWNMALILDTQLGRVDSAYAEYIEISNRYWDSPYQRYAAKNAVALARDAAMAEVAKAEEQASEEQTVSIEELRRQAEAEGIEDFNFRARMKLEERSLSGPEQKLADAYDNFIKLFPHEEETPLFLANAGALYYSHNQFRQALKYFKTLMRHFPGDEQVAQAQFAIMESYFGKADFQSSEIIARKIVNSDASEDIRQRGRRRLAESIYLNAEMLAESNQHYEAGKEYQRVVKEVPTSEFADLALFNAAVEYDKANDYMRAIESYNYLLATHPNSVYIYDAQNNLAFDYVELGDYHNAALTYQRLATIHPDEKQARDALYNASLYYAKAFEYERAINANQLFLQRFPKDEQADELAFEIPRFYEQMNKSDEAFEGYEEYVELFPDSPKSVEAFYRRGMYLRGRQQMRGALVEFQKALLQNRDLEERNEEGNIYFAAESEFAMAQIKFAQFKQIHFQLPEAALERSKTEKKEYLLEIVRHLGNVASYGTLRVYEATFLIGQVYEEFAQTWAKQEIPERDPTWQAVAQKEVNDAARVLYERASRAYRNSILSLMSLARSYRNYILEEASAEIIVESDSNTIVQQDSVLRIAGIYIKKSKIGLSKTNYQIGFLALQSAEAVMQAPIPSGLDDYSELVYRRKLIETAVTPLILDTFKSFKNALAEADSFSIQSQWVEMTKLEIIQSRNIIPNRYSDLALYGLYHVSDNFQSYRKLVFGGESFEQVLNDLQMFSEQIGNILGFSRETFAIAVQKYDEIIKTAADLRIEMKYIQSSKDSLFHTVFVYAMRCETLSRTAKSLGDQARNRFLDSGRPIYEEGLFTFESNYFALRRIEQTALEIGYEKAQEYNADNIYTKNITLQLVRFDPEQYAGLLGMTVETHHFNTDTTWVTREAHEDGWMRPGFVDTSWSAAAVVDPEGCIWKSPVHDTTTVSVPDSVSRQVPRDVYFRKSFSVKGLAVSCSIEIESDQMISIYFNGDLIKRLVGKEEEETVFNLSDLLVDGKNVIAIHARNNRKRLEGLCAGLEVKSLPQWEDVQKKLNHRIESEI